ESTSDVGAYYFRNVVGVAGHVDTQQLRKAGLSFYASAGGNHEIARRVEIDGFFDYEEFPTYQLDRGRFENELRECNPRTGVDAVGGCRVESVQLGRSEH